MTGGAARRRASRSTVLGTRLSLALAAVAGLVVLAIFFLLDPSQEATPLPPVAYDEADLPPEFSPVETELVADVTALEGGAEFRAGVLFTMRPGWFVFWRDPGEAGLPTRVDIRAPEGFTVGDLGWPVPTRFQQPGNLLGYGYTDRVLLAATVTAPESLEAVSEIPVRATVQWLSCERVCVPGVSDLEIRLPVGPSQTSGRENIFGLWRRHQPAPPENAVGSPVIEFARDERGSGRVRYDVILSWASAPTDVEWFPVADAHVQIEEASTITDAQRTRLSFVTIRVSPPGIESPVLASVLAYTDASGVRRGLTLDVPLGDGLLSAP